MFCFPAQPQHVERILKSSNCHESMVLPETDKRWGHDESAERWHATISHFWIWTSKITFCHIRTLGPVRTLGPDKLPVLATDIKNVYKTLTHSHAKLVTDLNPLELWLPLLLSGVSVWKTARWTDRIWLWSYLLWNVWLHLGLKRPLTCSNFTAVKF